MANKLQRDTIAGSTTNSTTGNQDKAKQFTKVPNKRRVKDSVSMVDANKQSVVSSSNPAAGEANSTVILPFHSCFV
ncbi:MAG TPA: hypothetical protein VHB48_20735 [Chitinophagaceae bacterium]|nr:hypothetical protein [Chitinophagaceae bacterium]